MPRDPTKTYTDVLALAGIAVEPLCVDGGGELLRAQAEVVRKATQALAFEVEPSCFVRSLQEDCR